MELLTTREAAKILQVTPVRVRQMIREGKIEARQVGRDYVIEENSLKSVKTYGKAGRPTKKAQNGGNKSGDNQKSQSFAEAAAKYIGSVGSGTNDLGSNKKHLEGFGTKQSERENKSNRG